MRRHGRFPHWVRTAAGLSRDGIDVVDPQVLTRPLRLAPDEAISLIVGGVEALAIRVQLAAHFKSAYGRETGKRRPAKVKFGSQIEAIHLLMNGVGVIGHGVVTVAAGCDHAMEKRLVMWASIWEPSPRTNRPWE